MAEINYSIAYHFNQYGHSHLLSPLYSSVLTLLIPANLIKMFKSVYIYSIRTAQLDFA